MKPEASRGGGVACPDPPACSLAEPGAGKSHAGICEGGAGQPVSLPRPFRLNAVFEYSWVGKAQR